MLTKLRVGILNVQNKMVEEQGNRERSNPVLTS